MQQGLKQSCCGRIPVHNDSETPMLNGLSGKTAVLTGAGSGFGLECMRIAASAGWLLVLVDVEE